MSAPQPWDGYCVLDDPGFGERGIDKRDATEEGRKEVDAEMESDRQWEAECCAYKAKHVKCCNHYGNKSAQQPPPVEVK